MFRIAAVADLHAGADSAGTIRPHFVDLPNKADLLLLAGDLTCVGDPAEAAVLVEELHDLAVPIIAVLGNHDYHADREAAMVARLERSGVRVLDGEGAVVEVNGVQVGIAGVKGFGGGFAGACGDDFGEPEMRAFIGHTKAQARHLESALRGLACDLRVALLHYAPIPETLRGERLEIYPFLGSYLLAEAIDRAGADLILHGHAHNGSEQGATPGGIPVHNVAQPVLGQSYGLFDLDPERHPTARRIDRSVVGPRARC